MLADGASEHLADLLQIALMRGMGVFVLRRDGTVRDLQNGNRVSVDRYAELPPFQRVVGGCDWFDAATGLSFTRDPAWGDHLARLKAVSKIGLFTIRVVVADQAQAQPGAGRWCHLVAQYLMAPSGLVSVLEEDRVALPDGR